MRDSERCRECGTLKGYTNRFNRRVLLLWLAVAFILGAFLGYILGR